MDSNLASAAQEYLSKREQMGARKAAAHVMQKYGVTSIALSEHLRDHGQLLSQQSALAVTAASEVHYLGAPSDDPRSDPRHPANPLSLGL